MYVHLHHHSGSETRVTELSLGEYAGRIRQEGTGRLEFWYRLQSETSQWERKRKTGWWFGTWLLFSHILGTIIPFDFHIFSEGWLNHQPGKKFGPLGFSLKELCQRIAERMNYFEDDIWQLCHINVLIHG